MIPFPDKKYDIIYADPAWHYGSVMPKGLDITHHYATIPFEQMNSLPVANLAKDDCLLFLWVVSPLLDDCIDTGKAWGFEYSTIAFGWDKQRPVWGNYTHSQLELCLVFKRGKMPEPRGKENIMQFLSCKKGAHSVKPLEIKHRITEMFPTQSKIELFARPLPMFKGLDDGWDYWGQEV